MKSVDAVVVLTLAFFPASAMAADQVGLVTQIEGTVTLFSHPSKTLQKEEGTHATFNGEYFLVKPAHVGDPVEQGNILRTAPGSKARVVYPNGDQINVAPATAYRISWEMDTSDAATAKPGMELMYGKIRGVVEKGGPRGKFKVRTNTAVMGVRGTDFFVSEAGGNGKTEVSVMRGEVDVSSLVSTASVAISVKAGYSATLAASPEDKTPETFVPRRTTQEQLKKIDTSSEIKAMSAKELEGESKAVASQVQALEAKALQATLKDVKTYDPVAYARLEASQLTHASQVNSAVIQTLLETAPKEPANKKPRKGDMKDLDQDVYRKYFKDVK